MSVFDTLLHPVRTFTQPAHDLAVRRAESRMSAYVYGDVLVLAATAGVSTDEIRTGRAVLIVLGTVLSTYLAHVLADTVGAVFAGHGSADLIRADLRDSLPVLSAGLPSFALLGAAAIGWPGVLWAQALASAVLIGRLAGIGTGLQQAAQRCQHPHRSAIRRSSCTDCCSGHRDQTSPHSLSDPVLLYQVS